MLALSVKLFCEKMSDNKLIDEFYAKKDVTEPPNQDLNTNKRDFSNISTEDSPDAKKPAYESSAVDDVCSQPSTDAPPAWVEGIIGALKKITQRSDTMASKIDSVLSQVSSLSTKVDNISSEFENKLATHKSEVLEEVSTLTAKIDDLSAHYDAKLNDYKTEMNTRLNELTAGYEFTCAALDETKTSYNDLVVRQDITKRKVKSCEEKIDALEQYGRRNCLLFHGIPEVSTENTDDLVLKTASEKLELNLDLSDIGRSHRLGAPRTDKKPPTNYCSLLPI